LEFEDGRRYVAKINRSKLSPLFREEAAGLRRLHESKTVRTPEPLAISESRNHCVLLMTYLEPARPNTEAWQRFGRDLAALHASQAGERYGLEMSNHLGTTYQPNDWCDDWVEFNAHHRLGHQVRLCHDSKQLDAAETAMI